MPSSRFSGLEVPIEPLNAPTPGRDGYDGLNPHTETLPAGWKHPHPDARPLPSAILLEHDVAIKVRDGTTLYADVLRPPNTTEKVPALICWSPFGKKFNGLTSLGYMTPWNLGIPSGTLSGLEKFEAPDPADWVPRGYAIVNIDTRGAFDSGDENTPMVIMGGQEAEDGYDAIEVVAAMSWCSGSVGLAGNSHLAIAQWFIAALRPPSLKAIAPWEGCGDLYREQFARGGVYAGDLFDELIIKHMLKGRGGIESFREMYARHPLANAWWNDKRPDMKQINVPTYITGTWTNTMHGMGAIRAWLEVQSKEKWLRWHPWQEWFDLWGNPEAKDELFAFFDRYLKGVDNGWEKTPKVRMSLLRFGEKTPQAIENIVEEDFPPARTQYKEFFLGTEETLISTTAPETKTTVSYDSESVNSFQEFKPEQETEVVLYKGPVGILRASHRAIDETRSMHPHWPFHPHEKEEKITPGEVVRPDIGIWALGVEYEAGESSE